MGSVDAAPSQVGGEDQGGSLIGELAHVSVIVAAAVSRLIGIGERIITSGGQSDNHRLMVGIDRDIPAPVDSLSSQIGGIIQVEIKGEEIEGQKQEPNQTAQQQYIFIHKKLLYLKLLKERQRDLSNFRSC